MRVLYDPTFSERGVLMCAGRKLRAKDPFDFQARRAAAPAPFHRLVAALPASTMCTKQAGCTKGLLCTSE